MTAAKLIDLRLAWGIGSYVGMRPLPHGAGTGTLRHCMARQVLRFEEAEADCDKALALELNPKTLLRRGTARRGRLDLDGARRDYQHVLSLEPNNKCACGA